MSFSDDPILQDLYESFKEVCTKEGYDCRRVDDAGNVPRILPEILARISDCAFTIVDLSDEKANVYYELGYAEALGKPLIVTAKMGTKLPFDVKDIPVLFWANQTGLKTQLQEKVKEIRARQGR
jgi:nucleoside 2-deoxyribosyltransferase